MTEIHLCWSHQVWIQTILEKLDHCLRSILTCYCIWYIWKSCYRLEERLDNSFWCFVCHLFKKSVRFLFSSHLVIFHFYAIFEYFEKRFYYSIAGQFQHATTDHIMTKSFIRIEFTDDSFNTILMNSMFARYWSVMRLVDEGRTLFCDQNMYGSWDMVCDR